MTDDRIAVEYEDGSMNVFPDGASIADAERQREFDDASIPSRIVRININVLSVVSGPLKRTAKTP